MDMIQVLIVEDDVKIAEIHRRFTEKVEGFEVVGVANSIDEARDLVEVLQPALVLLDIYFPNESGIDLLWEIRAKYRNTDLILITAAKEMEPLQEAIRGGAFDYIIKPALFSRFQDTLQRFRQARLRLAAQGSVAQQDVDQLLNPRSVAPLDRPQLPKGIDAITLDKVKKVFSAPPANGWSADEVGRQVGMSRSSARRYLEYLVDVDWLSADLLYGTVGRPERKYFRL
ncbi:response regulator [Geopsychrobacter electrodiphilus]|uniref:response regulator n=1 Tax=Geopsychrobacter electrodiphilus TaxID=225196 RepID=UPI0003812F5F|nr:response regulator [Geopsychrobacter electrodiphilus]